MSDFENSSPHQHGFGEAAPFLGHNDAVGGSSDDLQRESLLQQGAEVHVDELGHGGSEATTVGGSAAGHTDAQATNTPRDSHSARSRSSNSSVSSAVVATSRSSALSVMADDHSPGSLHDGLPVEELEVPLRGLERAVDNTGGDVPLDDARPAFFPGSQAVLSETHCNPGAALESPAVADTHAPNADDTPHDPDWGASNAGKISQSESYVSTSNVGAGVHDRLTSGGIVRCSCGGSAGVPLPNCAWSACRDCPPLDVPAPFPLTPAQHCPSTTTRWYHCLGNRQV